MQQLYLKHHGLPAMGVQGNQGNAGKKGQSVYIGFINDFFDYTEFDMDTNIRYTLRIKELMQKSTTLWNAYTDTYPIVTDNNEPIYYSGRFIEMNASPEGKDPRLTKVDVVDSMVEPIADNNTKIDQDKTFADIPTESYEFNFITDVAYTTVDNESLPYTLIYEYADEDINSNDNVSRTTSVSSIPVPAYKVKVNVKNQVFDYTDLKRIAEMAIVNLSSTEEQTELTNYISNTFYTFLNRIAEPLKNNKNANAFTGKFVKEDYDDTIFKDFAILQDEYKFQKSVEYNTNNKEYHSYDDTILHPETEDDGYTINDKPKIYLSDDLETFLAKLTTELKNILFDSNTNDFKDAISIIAKLAYIKQPIKTYPKYVNDYAASNSDYLLDDEGYMFIGLSDSLLYNYNNESGMYELNDSTYILNYLRNADADTAVIDMDNLLTVARDTFETVAAEYEVELSKTTDQLISDNTSSIVRWYPLDVKKVQIPTTLSTNINVGDIIYFYTDEETFANTSQIEYMVTITKDLIGADLQTLIEAATITYPFEYSVMNSDVIDDRGVVNNTVNIMVNNNAFGIESGYDNFQFRSIENILSKNDYCTLHLISINYNINSYSQNGILQLIAVSTANDESHQSLSLHKTSDTTVIAPSNKNIAIQNLGIQKDSTHINFELTDIVYDKYINFQNGYFVYDLMDSGNISVEYCLTPLQTTPILNFTYTINKTDFFKDAVENSDILSDYYIGYIVIHNGQIIDTDETNSDTLDVDIQPVALVRLLPNLIWKPSYYVLGDDIKSYITVNSKQQTLLNIADTSSFTTSDYTIGYDYDVIFTIRYKSGFKYYSNPSTISFIIGQTTTDGVTTTEVSDLLVNVTYYDGIDLSNNTIKTEGYININLPILTSNAISLDTSDDNINKFEIYANNKNNIIKQILINNHDVFNIDDSYKVNWLTVYKEDNETDITTNSTIYVYNIAVTDNIPDIVYNNVTYSTDNTDDYMRLLLDTEEQNSLLFNMLTSNKKLLSTSDRSIKILVVYDMYIGDDENDDPIYEEHYEETMLKQPGFTDPRTIPSFELTLSNCFTDLADVNTIDNGVLCNQFRTYLDIDINDFGIENWGIFGTDDISLSFTIKNHQYDNNNTKRFTIQQPYKRPTFKFITWDGLMAAKLLLSDENNTYYAYISNEASLTKLRDLTRKSILGASIYSALTRQLTSINTPNLSNYYALNFTADRDDCLTVNQDIYLTSNGGSLCTSDIQDGNKTYVIMDNNVVKACQYPYNMTSGMLHDISLNFELSLADVIKNNHIRVAIDFEMANPIQASMFLQFVVSNILVKYGKNNKVSTFTSNAQSNSLLSTILLTLSNNLYNYKYKTDPLDVMFNSISVTAGSEDDEKSIESITGTVKKVGSEDNITVRTHFFNKDVYKSDLMDTLTIEGFNKVRILLLFTKWTDLEYKYGYFQDNISDININAIDPKDLINNDILNTDSIEYEYLNSDIANHNNSQLSDLNSAYKYLNIMYNASNTLNPKQRNGNYTFIYNDTEYLADKYDQVNNNSPLMISLNPYINIRTQLEIDSIDAWNFEYQVANPNANSSKLIPGENNVYGNGYLLLDPDNDNYKDNPYEEDNLLSLSDILTKAEQSCVDLYTLDTITVSNMKNSGYYPENNKLFRTLVQYMDWEYPWYYNDNINHNILVSPFDLLMLKNNSNSEITNKYSGKLKALKSYLGLDSYSDTDIKDKAISYNMCYNITPRVGYNTETGTTCVLMLRKPSIGYDSDINNYDSFTSYLNSTYKYTHNFEKYKTDIIK